VAGPWFHPRLSVPVQYIQWHYEGFPILLLLAAGMLYYCFLILPSDSPFYCQ